MKKYIYFTLLILSVSIVYFTSYALATYNMTSSINIREEYNDNINLTETEEEDDFITTISPNVLFEYSPNKIMDMSLNYSLRYRFYNEHNELDETSIEETQNTLFQAQIRPLSRLFIDISDEYNKVPVSVRSRTAADYTSVNLTDHNSFAISPYLEIPLMSTITSRFGYRYNNIWYDDDTLVDSEAHTAFLTLDKKFTSRINGTLKYEYYAYRPDLTDSTGIVDEYDRHNGSAAIFYQVNEDFDISGEIGESWLEFKEKDDTNTTFWNTAANYKFSFMGGPSLLGITYSSSVGDDAEAGAVETRRVDLNLSTGRTFVLTVNPYYSVAEYINVNREDEITGAALEIRGPLSGKIDLVVSGDIEKQEFSPEDNEVDRYSVGSNLDFRLGRITTASLGYRFNSRNSDLANDDYENNIIWLMVRLIY